MPGRTEGRAAGPPLPFMSRNEARTAAAPATPTDQLNFCRCHPHPGFLTCSPAPGSGGKKSADREHQDRSPARAHLPARSGQSGEKMNGRAWSERFKDVGQGARGAREARGAPVLPTWTLGRSCAQPCPRAPSPRVGAGRGSWRAARRSPLLREQRRRWAARRRADSSSCSPCAWLESPVLCNSIPPRPELPRRPTRSKGWSTHALGSPSRPRLLTPLSPQWILASTPGVLSNLCEKAVPFSRDVHTHTLQPSNQPMEFSQRPRRPRKSSERWCHCLKNTQLD